MSRGNPAIEDVLAALRSSGEAGDTLCLHAAEVIELLRGRPCPYVSGTVTHHCTLTPFTLTDEEREAVAVAAEAYADDHGERFAATLRRLLERLK
jgi:hypothetical protein